ncbi:Putative ribonuclease H protein At1g65750 [Linum perenne]
MSPPNSDLGEDVCTWGLGHNGKFSIGSAYDLVHETTDQRPEVDWKVVWKWTGPCKIQYFLWLVAQGKLLTNLERKRRHLTEDGECPRCANSDESILHVLRDCVFAQQVWDQLGISSTAPIRAEPCPIKWLKMMMQHEKVSELSILCWYLWKARNEWVFAGTNATAISTTNRIHSWHSIVSSTFKHQELMSMGKQGSVLADRSKAAAGGLIRNADGRCLYAFSINLGRCSIMRAELRGLIEGLKRAWESGFRRVDARVDSQAILSLIRGDNLTDHPHGVEVAALRELIERDWEVTISHTYREGNSAADYLADLGHGFPLGVHQITSYDCNLNYFLRRDCIGISEPRLISVN